MHAFMQEAAAVGEPVLVALPGSHLEHVREALGDDMADARLEDLEEVGRNPGRLLSMIEEWVASHDGHARVVSEVVWPGRSRAEAVEALRHEALVNHALAGSGATIMSPFDARHLDEDILAGVEMTHPTVVEGGQRRAGTSYTDPMSTTFRELWPLEDPPGPVSEHPLDGTLMELRTAIADDPVLGSLSGRAPVRPRVRDQRGRQQRGQARQRDVPDSHLARRGRGRDRGPLALRDR